MKKIFIDPMTFYQDAFRLAKKIYDSKFYPDYLIALWRGGASVGVIVHEYLIFKGLTPYHIPIRTQAYEGLRPLKKISVDVKGMGHVLRTMKSGENLLLVDDVFDTGKTVYNVTNIIRSRAKNCPEIKIATLYYKPKRNETPIKPDYYIKTYNGWLIFPHELEGLSAEEIKLKEMDLQKIL